MPRDNFAMSENSGSFGMQQRQDRFDAIGDLIVGPPGPPGPQGPPGADGTVSFDELTPAQKESLRGEGVPAGGTTGQVLAKASNTDYATEWIDAGGGGGTSNYNDLSNKPSINGNTLSGNKTAAQLGLATPSDIPTVPVQSVNGKTGAVVLSASDVGAGTYSKPSGGIPKTDLASAVQTSLGKADSALQAVPSTYRTAAAQDVIDAAQDAEIETRAQADEVGIVITGKRPSMSVTAGQYVIVRNGTISGITDGLYTANSALSPSTDVTAANLMAVNKGGLNSLQSQIEDSGWIDLVLTSDYTLYGLTSVAQYRKIGTLVFVIAQVKPTAEIAASSTASVVANLPDGFRPPIGVTFVCQGSGINRFCMQINPNGNIGISRYGTTASTNIPTNAWLPINALYFTT